MENHKSVMLDFCLECEYDGRIISVIRSDIHIPYSIEHPVCLQHIVAPASLEKVEQLLQQVQQDGICIDWEVQVPHAEEMRWMLLSAFRVQQALIVIGSSRQVAHDQALLDEIMRINNEQNSQIRQLTKEILELSRQLQHHTPGSR